MALERPECGGLGVIGGCGGPQDLDLQLDQLLSLPVPNSALPLQLLLMHPLLCLAIFLSDARPIVVYDTDPSMFNPVQPIFDERTSLFLALRASLADISFCAPAVFPALFRGWHFTVQLFCCVRPLLPLSRETTKKASLTEGARRYLHTRGAWLLAPSTKQY